MAASPPIQPLWDLSNRKDLGVNPSTGLPMAPLDGFSSRSLRRMGGSNANGVTPGRGLSVGEIMSQREGRSNAYYTATGQDVAPGTILNASGWNTSGVGPGTPGYRGSYANGAYNGGYGTGRPGASSSADYYRNRGSSLDRFNNNSQTNRLPDETGPWSDRTTFGNINGFRQYGGPVRRGGRYVVGEDGPEVVVMPQEGYVIPNPRSRRAPSFRNSDEYYAFRDQTVGNPLDRGMRRYGAPTVSQFAPAPTASQFQQRSSEPQFSSVSPTLGNSMDVGMDDVFMASPLDEIEGRPAYQHGEIKPSSDGWYWKYNAATGKGERVAPINPYQDNVNAPSAPVESLSPIERYRDMQNRLSALRREADVGFADQQQFNKAQFVQPQVQGLTGGPTPTGRAISGRYGSGSVSNAPVERSFTVDRTDGTQGRYGNIADAATESRAESATRRMRGRRY